MCILFKISDYIIIKILAGCVIVLAALIGQMVILIIMVFAIRLSTKVMTMIITTTA